MEYRFAENLLTSRAKLSSLLERVNQLSETSHSHVEGMLGMRDELCKPLVALVSGDAGVGGSEVLNILLGKKVSSAFKSKKNSAVVFSKALDTSDFSLPVKCIEQADLSDLMCVEGAPCNHLTEELTVELDTWQEKADAILWVLSAENPWSATTWGRIEKLSPELLDKSIVVITHIESYAQSDIDVMMGHLNNLSQQRIGRVLPFIPVSNKTEPFTGYSDVWERMNHLLDHSPPRRGYMAKVRDKLHRVLEKIENLLDERSRSLEGDRGFLSSLEADIDRQRERETQLYAGRGVNLSKEFVDEIDPLLERVHQRCSVVPSLLSLFGFGRISVDVENYFIDHVSNAFVVRAEKDCQKILRDCKEQWRKMHNHLEERIGTDVGEFEFEAFHEVIPKLMKMQEKTAKTAILSMKLRMTLECMLLPRRVKLKQWLMITLGLVILAGMLGTFRVPPGEIPALVILGGSLVTFGCFVWVAMTSRKQIVATVADRVVDLRTDFTEKVIESYQDMIRELFTGYAPMFESVRIKIADAKSQLEPLLKEQSNLFLELKIVENEML